MIKRYIKKRADVIHLRGSGGRFPRTINVQITKNLPNPISASKGTKLTSAI